MNRLVWFLIIILSSVFGYVYAESEFEDDFSQGSSQNNTPMGLEFTGFLEVEQGGNITGVGAHQRESNDQDWVMANRRFRLQTTKSNNQGAIFAKLDFNRDDVVQSTSIDIRELRLKYTPLSWIDLSVGKQVSTWGVGDMLFINDLFPKNWVANFQGRDMESLKESSYSARATSYLGNLTFDLVYTPKFSPDTTPTGRYFSIYNPNSGTVVANNNASTEIQSDRISNSYKDSEVAASLKYPIGSHQVALYGYTGYFKNPKGMKMSDGYLVSHYPRLNAYGASTEGQIGPGIFSAEIGYYDSREDSLGNNPLIENSSLKYLVGYKFDLSAYLSIGGQWFQEKMIDYDNYIQTINSPYSKKELQNTYTMRVTLKLQQETLWMNLFTYIRPEDKDSFTKFDISKRLDDNFLVTTGINIFTGRENYRDREFGMLRDDDNAFVRFKYNI